MAQSLVPCPSCARHVLATEQSCPFCRSALPDSLASAVIPGTTQRLSRAAAFAFTASLTITGCGGEAAPTPSDSGVQKDSSADGASDGSDDGGNQAIYGAPAYGLPAPDAGADTGDHDASGIALYGAPVVRDSGEG